jgi:hypothetical protein
MALHLTKVAFGAASLDDLFAWFESRGSEAFLTTRYLPKRHAEIVEGGSLFWILKHQLVARSPILRFAEAEGGKTHIVIDTRTVRVMPRPCRAHQGWRYLADADAPRDLDEAAAGEMLPADLAGELSRLGLV